MRQTRQIHDIDVRRLRISDQASINDHFLRLDADSRRARFCGAISDAGVATYAAKLFHPDSLICGASIEGELRGLVELRGAYPSWHATAEAAFSVEPAWQNIGIGDALFDRIFAMAQNRGVRTIHMMCLRENSRMKHLAAKHHATLLYDQDAIAAVLHPCWPTPSSMAKEVFGESRSYAHMMRDWGTRRRATA